MLASWTAVVIGRRHHAGVGINDASKIGTGFHIELAIGPEDEIVLADDATRIALYRCPRCQVRVIRKSHKRRVSFFHEFDPSGRCSRDKARLMSAQYIILLTLQQFLNGRRSRPILVRRCPGLNILLGCDRRVDGALDDFDEVRMWRADTDLSGGVYLYRSGQRVALIHVGYSASQSVALPASEELSGLELRAEDVLACPDRWLPVRDSLSPVYCEECKSAESAYAKRYSNGYIFDEMICYNCKKATPVFMWTGEAWSETPPPDPRPTTVRRCYSTTVQRHYWANTCEHCGVLQGDFFLHSEPDSPFFGISSVVSLQNMRRLSVEGWSDHERKILIKEFLANPSSGVLRPPEV